MIFRTFLYFSKVILSIVLYYHLSAQPLSAQILVGPSIGGQLNSYVFDNKDNKDLYKLKSDINFNAGASVSFRAHKNYFLHTSFLYSQKSKIIDGTIDPTLKNNTTLRFIEVPILYTAEFESSFGRDKVFKWYLGIGPTISYWLGGKGTLLAGDLNENIINPPNYVLPYKITFNKDSASVKMNEMNVNDPNRIQLGLNISVGLVFEPIEKQKLMFTARYGFGQSFLSRTSKGEFGLPGILFYEDELKVRNQEFVLSLHYLFDLRTEQRNKGKSTSKVKRGKSKN